MLSTDLLKVLFNTTDIIEKNVVSNLTKSQWNRDKITNVNH